MDPTFTIRHALTPEQHRQHVMLHIKYNPINRIERIILLCLFFISLPLGILLKEPRILSRLIVGLPLFFYELFFKPAFRSFLKEKTGKEFTALK